MSKVIYRVMVFYIAFTALLSNSSLAADSKNMQIESLKALLESAQLHDTVRINTMIELCSALKSKDPEAAFYYGKNAINMAKNLQLDNQTANGLNILGVVYWQLCELGSAMDHLLEAKHIHEKNSNKIGTATTMTNIGLIYSYKSHYDKALEYFFEAFRIFENEDYKAGMAPTLNNIGIVHQNRQNYDLSEYYHNFSLEIKEELNDKKGMAFSFNNLGIVNQKREQYEKAIEYFRKALEIRKNIGDTREEAVTTSHIGYLYFLRQDYNEALGHLHTALKLYEKVNDQGGVSQTINYLGQTYMGINDLSKAEECFKNSLHLAQKIGLSRVITENYDNLAKLYAKKNNYSRAYDFQQKYLNIKDSIYSEESMQRIWQFQMLFDSDKKEREVELYRKASHINALNYEKQRLLKNFLFAAVIVVIILLFLLYNRYLVINKTNKLLKKQKDEITKSNNELINLNKVLLEQKNKVDDLNQKLHQTNQKLIESEKHLIEVNVTKDKLFSIISHDLRNPFASIVSFSRMLKRDIESLSKEDLQELALELDKTVVNINDLLENLLQWSRSHFGKIKYNPQYVDMTEIVNENVKLFLSKAKEKEISIENRLNSNLIVWADQNMTDTVVRNLLSNAIKFTNNKGKIQLFYKTDNNNVYVSVKDNGIGISEENQEKLFCTDSLLSTFGTHDEKGSGIGLLLCKEFVEKQKGKIYFESKEGKGSVFTFLLPLNETI